MPNKDLSVQHSILYTIIHLILALISFHFLAFLQVFLNNRFLEFNRYSLYWYQSVIRILVYKYNIQTKNIIRWTKVHKNSKKNQFCKI